MNTKYAILDNALQTPEQLEKAEKVGEVIAIGSDLTKDLMKDPPKYEVQQPVSAQSYQKMTPEQKKLHFPVNRAMRRKQGIR